MPTSRFRKETLLYSSDETELLPRVWVPAGSGACSSLESSLSVLLRKFEKKKKKRRDVICKLLLLPTPLAATPKTCHLFGRSQKEGEDRQGRAAEMALGSVLQETPSQRTVRVG